MYYTLISLLRDNLEKKIKICPNTLKTETEFEAINRV